MLFSTVKHCQSTSFLNVMVFVSESITAFRSTDIKERGQLGSLGLN